MRRKVNLQNQKQSAQLIQKPPKKNLVIVIAIVVIISIAILWLIFKEKSKPGESLGVKKTIEKFCPEVKFRAEISNNELYITNEGDVPIHEINIKRIDAAGTSKIKNVTINLYGDFIFSNISLSDAGLVGVEKGERVLIIPVLLVEESKGKTKKYICPESLAYELEI